MTPATRTAASAATRASGKPRGPSAFACNPACVMCGAPAEHVDHITPHKGNPALFWNWNNLQALCAHCHNSVKQENERQAASSVRGH